MMSENDIDAPKSATRTKGWGLFGFCGGFSVIASCLLYWWSTHLIIGDARFWIAGLFCAPPYLFACLGFVQAVSAVSPTRTQIISAPLDRCVWNSFYLPANALHLLSPFIDGHTECQWSHLISV
jgi:hypothetical protein